MYNRCDCCIYIHCLWILIKNPQPFQVTHIKFDSEESVRLRECLCRTKASVGSNFVIFPPFESSMECSKSEKTYGRWVREQSENHWQCGVSSVILFSTVKIADQLSVKVVWHSGRRTSRWQNKLQNQWSFVVEWAIAQYSTSMLS